MFQNITYHAIELPIFLLMAVMGKSNLKMTNNSYASEFILKFCLL